MRKFKLTGAFLVISAVTLIIAAIVILNVSSSQEVMSGDRRSVMALRSRAAVLVRHQR